MKELPEDVLRRLTHFLCVLDSIRLENAICTKLYNTQHYEKLKEWEPLSNTLRLFKKGTFRTYKLYSYVEDGITYTDVSVSPKCRSFQCKHKQNVSPSKASHWVLSCITEGDNIGFGKITYSINY